MYNTYIYILCIIDTFYIYIYIKLNMYKDDTETSQGQ